MGKKSALIYEEFYMGVQALPDTKMKAEAYDAYCRLTLYGEEYDGDNIAIKVLLASVQGKIDQANSNYQKKVDAINKVNGQKRTSKRDNERQRTTSHDNVRQRTTKNDTDSVIVTVTDTVIDSPTENNTRVRADHSEYAAKIEEIVSYLNAVTGSKYVPTKDIADLIADRLDDGFAVDDFRAVIDKKYKHWGKDPKFKHFLTPSTLFGAKFQNYLNESCDPIPEARSGTPKKNSFDFEEKNNYNDSDIAKMMFARATAGF